VTDTEKTSNSGGKPLSGMKEICAYVGKSEKTVRRYISDESFPAVMLAGVWESDTALVDGWRVSRIDSRVQRE